MPPWSKDRLQQEINNLWKLHIKKYGKPKKVNNQEIDIFDLGYFLTDQSELPQDIIAPRILTPRGMLVFGGSPKVGKSDFLLSLFTYLAAGVEFLWFKTIKPLKIFYFQTEVEYHYLRERLQNIKLPKELLRQALHNLYITPSNKKISLNDEGIKNLVGNVKKALNGLPDIIAVDPIRNVFDGGRVGATENENDAMIFFLRERIEKLRDMINPEAGIVLVHHTKKITRQQLEEDPFQAFSGASSLRGYYTSGALLYKSETNDHHRHLIFELRNGKAIRPKILQKEDDVWSEVNIIEERIAHKTKGTLYDRERERRINVIIKLLEADSIKGKFYLMKQFAQKYQNYKGLGGRRAIYDDCSVAATQGIIKFFDNPEEYGINLVGKNASFGFMCSENMYMNTIKVINGETNEITKDYIKILPTHYKEECDGRKTVMINNENWNVE
ncbi:AAA family ATPase [Rickettsia hoogstraalii]|uniref:AAA family ATPase n=1 Tax=Rickettsia hoogstraalii TaxID=467174 RepID=UPI0006949F69|nr:AAA family ATPase [Rickettsia hoogstraalii]